MSTGRATMHCLHVADWLTDWLSDCSDCSGHRSIIDGRDVTRRRVARQPNNPRNARDSTPSDLRRKRPATDVVAPDLAGCSNATSGGPADQPIVAVAVTFNEVARQVFRRDAQQETEKSRKNAGVRSARPLAAISTSIGRQPVTSGTCNWREMKFLPLRRRTRRQIGRREQDEWFSFGISASVRSGPIRTTHFGVGSSNSDFLFGLLLVMRVHRSPPLD